MSINMKRRAVLSVAFVAAFSSSAQAQVQWFSSVEALLLAPKTNTQGFDGFFYEGAPATAETGGNYGSSLEGGVRFTLGAQDCACGIGARVRYFTFDNNVDYTGEWENGGGPVVLNGGVDIDVDALDIEVTQRGRFNYWDFLVSGGLRYGRVDIEDNTGIFNGLGAAVFFGATGATFEGVGPTFAGQAKRYIGDTGVSLIGRGRTALLFGDLDVYSAFIDDGLLRIQDEFVQVWEFQFGLGYDRACSLGTANLGVFWEAQRWDSESNALGDLALHGLSLMGGLTY